MVAVTYHVVLGAEQAAQRDWPIGYFEAVLAPPAKVKVIYYFV